MNKSNVSREKIFATLFALVFAIGFTLGGVSVGVIPVYKQLSGWWKTNSFVPVTANVLSTELKINNGKTTIYQALAEFSYQYQGQHYFSNTIHLSDSRSDNISNYHEDIYKQLNKAKNNATPVTLWVNPRQPEQAVYDRSIRWMVILFLLPFAVLSP